MEVEDLFCGVGGFTCGALMEGAVVSSGVDNSDAALRAWSENVPASTSRLHEIKVGEALPYDDPTRHVHASPPCTELSRAKAYRTEDQADSGLSLLRWTIECLKSLTSWSIETVATSKTRQLFDEYAPYVAYKVIDAYDFGIPQTASAPHRWPASVDSRVFSRRTRTHRDHTRSVHAPIRTRPSCISREEHFTGIEQQSVYKIRRRV